MTRPGTPATEPMVTPPNARPLKTIPPARDRLQSRLLVWTIMPILWVMDGMWSVRLTLHAPTIPHFHMMFLESLGVSVCFALLAWRLKAATPIAAVSGGVICLSLLYGTQRYQSPLVYSALIQLIVLFVLTFLATRAGRHRKTASGLAENRSGRTTSQVVANLGFAALLAHPLGLIMLAFYLRSHFAAHIATVIVSVGVSSALAEATADTVSSEIGQAFGGRPFMLTTLRSVPPGTDGAISLNGTLAGIASAAIIVALGATTMDISLPQCLVAFAAGVAGLFFDSLLGATVERKGWLGNDLVNFTSTAFAAGISILAIHLGQNYLSR